jgi:hypothetical protein
VQRFLDGTSVYPDEWNDFIKRENPSVRLDSYRRRCLDLDPFVNRTAQPDPKAQAELRKMVEELRTLS